MKFIETVERWLSRRKGKKKVAVCHRFQFGKMKSSGGDGSGVNGCKTM